MADRTGPFAEAITLHRRAHHPGEALGCTDPDCVAAIDAAYKASTAGGKAVTIVRPGTRHPPGVGCGDNPGEGASR